MCSIPKTGTQVHKSSPLVLLLKSEHPLLKNFLHDQSLWYSFTCLSGWFCYNSPKRIDVMNYCVQRDLFQHDLHWIEVCKDKCMCVWNKTLRFIMIHKYILGHWSSRIKMTDEQLKVLYDMIISTSEITKFFFTGWICWSLVSSSSNLWYIFLKIVFEILRILSSGRNVCVYK